MVERPDDPRTPPSTTAPAPGTTDPAVVDLDEVLLRPHVSPRKRAAQAGVVLAVVLVVVGLLHGIGSSPQSTASVRPTATPIPPTVVIDGNVTFGTLTVNGHTLKGSLPLVTRLFHQGANVVTLAAPPFLPHTCRIGWFIGEATGDSGCSTSPGGPYRIGGAMVTPTFSVTVLVGSTDLPPNLGAGAEGVVTQAIAAVPLPTVVPTGQYYATGLDNQGHVAARPAATPLHADVRFGTPTPVPGNAGVCGLTLLCPAPLDRQLTLPAGQHLWSVYVALTVSWRYLSPTGTVMVSPGWPLTSPVQVFLSYDASGGWSVGTLSPPPGVLDPGTQPLAHQLASSLCLVGTDLVGGLAPQGQTGAGLSIGIPHDQGAGGCEPQVVTAGGSTVQGTFLWRFGVLLAVDTGAHTLAPWLPIAPAGRGRSGRGLSASSVAAASCAPSWTSSPRSCAGGTGQTATCRRVWGRPSCRSATRTTSRTSSWSHHGLFWCARSAAKNVR